jgi:hypothetical protein
VKALKSAVFDWPAWWPTSSTQARLTVALYFCGAPAQRAKSWIPSLTRRIAAAAYGEPGKVDVLAMPEPFGARHHLSHQLRERRRILAGAMVPVSGEPGPAGRGGV